MEFVHVELKRDTWVYPEMKVETPYDAVKAVKELLQDMDREIVVCINMAASGRVINASVCSVGTSNMALISPAGILKTGILSGANCLLMIHNHPSGNLTPSREDIMTTDKMIKAYRLLDIQVLDHIIIGPDRQFYSMRARDTFDLPGSDYCAVLNDLRFDDLKPRHPDRGEAR